MGPNREMKQIRPGHNNPDFLLKSTQGIALSSIIILTPFLIYNVFYLQRHIISLLIFSGIILSGINIYLCRHGRYNKKLNLYGVFPVITMGIVAAIYKLGPPGTYWAYLGELALYFVLPEKEGRTTNIIFLFIVLPATFFSISFSFFVRFAVVLVGTSAYAYFAMREIHKQHKKLTKAALRDSLTGLYNRSILAEVLKHAIEIYSRHGTPMSLVMLDIDYFKKINDQYGHEKGDSVLKKISLLIKNGCRDIDLCFRLGGEEFLILLYNTTDTNSICVAEKLRKNIQNLSMNNEIKKPVTVSVGVSALRAGITMEEWLKTADAAMYQAKSAGRNQVKCLPRDC